MGFFAYTGRTWHFLPFLHLWEACMSSILKKGKPHGYGAGTLGSFIVFLVVLGWWCACRENGLPPLTLARRLSSTLTGIECQQLAGHAGRRRQQHIRIWDVGIMFPAHWEKVDQVRSQRSSRAFACGGRLSEECVFCLRENAFEVLLVCGSPPHGHHVQNSRVISYSSRLVL